MSSTPDLMRAVELMGSLGIMPAYDVENTEHCVDDAVHALSTLTDFITSEPEVLQLIKNKAEEKIYSEVMNSKQYEFIGSSGVFCAYVLPNSSDSIYDKEKEKNGTTSVYVSSKNLNIEKTKIGVILDTGAQFTIIADVERLNWANDFGNGK